MATILQPLHVLPVDTVLTFVAADALAAGFAKAAA